MPGPHPKRVLVTRSRQQGSALAVHLAAFGAHPILVPTIGIAPPESYTALDTAVATLSAFDWIVFTSANAVQAFGERCEMAKLSGPPQNRARDSYTPFAPGWGFAQSRIAALNTTEPRITTQPRIAAIGPATAQALSGLGLTPALIPPRAIAESLAQAIQPHTIPGRTRILLIRAQAARDALPDILSAAGAELTIAPAYRTIIPEDSIPLLQELFRTPENWPDGITFTSSSTAVNLLTLLQSAGLDLPVGDMQGKTILRASIGPITSQTLRELGYPPHFEAPQATVASLARIMAHHLGL